MDEQKCNVHRDPNQDPHPHACVDGFVYLGYLVFDEEIGAEVEQLEIVPCRRCEELKGSSEASENTSR